MRKAVLVFVVTVAAVVGVGALLLDLTVPADPLGGGSAVKKPPLPAVPPVGAFTPAGYAEYVAGYPDELGGPADARWWFFREAVDRGEVTAAYRAVGPAEADEAFRGLADWCVLPGTGLDRAKAAAVLRELLAAHAGRGDPLADLFTARLLVWDGKATEAVPLLVEAGRRLAAAGRWGDAGKHFVAAFWPLHLRQPADADRLLAGWAAAAPDDDRLAGCRMLADFGQGRYADCLAAADRYLAAAPVAVPMTVLLPSRFDAGLMRARALAHLGRFAEADAALTAAGGPADPQTPYVELLIALLAGDDERADRLLGSGRVEVKAVYADERFGPLLRADWAAGLRRKYPPPAK